MELYPSITVFQTGVLKKKRMKLDGKTFRAETGAWAFYIPGLQLKLFHSHDSFMTCRYPRAPERKAIEQGNALLPSDTYSLAEWRAVYSKSVVRRAAENFVAASLLYDAGLGPRPQGLCLVLDYRSATYKKPSINAGLFIDDLNAYPPRVPVTMCEMLSAGVQPDKIQSCLRQQINGYISDLNSVVGVMPTDAEKRISQLELHMRKSLERNVKLNTRLAPPSIFNSFRRIFF